MPSEIKYSLYKYSSSALEATRLRSILLFNGKVEKQKRQDLMTKAVLSIILADSGSATREGVLEKLNTQFRLNFKAKELDTQIKRLHQLDLLESIDEPLTVKDKDKKGRSYFDKLEQDTETLLEGILKVAAEKYVQRPITTPNPIKNTIRKALSVFYGINGYSFFGIQKQEEVSMEEAAISVVKNEIGDARIAESIIRALADVIKEPDEFQKSVLTQWARAFVAMESMSLDPLLNNFKSKNLREKEFIIDTDVVLYCLTSNARYSEDYRQMIAKLKDVGCKMYIVPEVKTEVQKHLDAAKKRYASYGDRLLEYPDEILYEKVSNVFIDDYVHVERNAEEKTPFRFYLEEFYDPENPALLHTKMSNAFTDSALRNTLKVDTVDPKFTELESEVYNLTVLTPKAQNRSEEENHAVSHLDAYLYMAAKNSNEGLDETAMLSGKTYILTDSTRAMRAAENLGWEKKNVICHPNALMALLMEMGDVKSQETIINLFDNPFLAYVADSVWGEISPLIEKGADVKYKGFDRLRSDVDKQFDKLLTEEMTDEERHKTLQEYEVYLPAMVKAGKEREDKQLARIEQLEQENAGLRRSLVKAHSVKAKPGKNVNLPSRNKKKRK